MKIILSYLQRVYRGYDYGGYGEVVEPDENLPLQGGKSGSSEDKSEGGKGKEILSTRWLFAIFGCLGFTMLYGLKVNLSVAIMAMVNHTAVVHTNHSEGKSTCNHTENSKQELEDGPFVWDENVQGLVLAAYFYGYIATQVIGGWFAEKYSAKHLFGYGVLLNAVFSLLSPIAAKGSYGWLVTMRIGMGLAAGVTCPAMHLLIAKWSPVHERSKISSSVYAGMTMGTLLMLPLSGLLADSWGWESVFYVEGAITVVWYVLWLFLVYDSPSDHPRITEQEKNMIESSLKKVPQQSKEKITVPWKEVWTSKAVWGIIIAHTCSNWGWYMLVVKLPTYMGYILHFNIRSNAALSAVPFICMWIFSMAFGALMDHVSTKKILSVTQARKVATATATFLPGLCLVAVTYVGCDTALAVFFLSIGTMFVGAMFSGFLSNHIDIAPPFAGTLIGISNTFATIPGIIMPSIIGFITYENQTLDAWRTIFYITLAIESIGAAGFWILGSGEQQPWAGKVEQKETEDAPLNEEKK